MEKKEDKFIDIERVFKSKSKKLGALMPRFVFRLIGNLVHQDEINAFLQKNGNLWGIDFTEKVAEYFQVKVSYYGIENLPDDPRVIVASNHPFGGIEGIMMTKFMCNHYGDVRVPSNDILMTIKNFRPLFIPINKHGSNSKLAAQIMDESLDSNIPFMIYPAGLVSRKNKGVLKDLEWKKTFITKAIQYNRPIVPTYVEGQNTKLFYFVAGLRKLLKIKANIEMFLLPHELFKARNKEFKIYFTPAVPAEFFDKRYKPAGWAELMKEYLYLYAAGDKRSFMDVVNERNT